MDWFGIIFAASACAFLVIAMGMAHVQARRIRTYRPVPAVVKSSEVIVKDDDGGKMYAPRVQYTYLTSSGPRHSDKTLAVKVSTGHSGWASRIIARYPAGLKTWAYVHPTDESKVFLVRDASPLPYALALFAMIFVSVGLGINMMNGVPRGWTDAQCVLTLVILWEAVGAICFMHFRRLGGKLGLGVQLAFLFYVGIGLVGLVAWDHLRLH